MNNTCNALQLATSTSASYYIDTGTATDNIYWYNGLPNHYVNYGFPQPTITFTTTTFEEVMKTHLEYGDEDLTFIAELAGFTKDEVRVKYKNPDDTKSDNPYILIIAESKTHPLKGKGEDSYKLEKTISLDKTKKLKFKAAQLTFENGLLTIKIEYADDVKVKELPLS